MKNDLLTSALAAIIGLVAAYFACDALIPELEPVSITTLSNVIDSEVAQPNEEIFNYRALNPTVDVFVGNCSKLSADGRCLDDIESVANDETETPETANEEN